MKGLCQLKKRNKYPNSSDSNRSDHEDKHLNELAWILCTVGRGYEMPSQ